MMLLKRNIKELNPNYPETPDYPYRILIVGDPRSGKKMRYLI